jgi:prepilin peptidase CpaA
LLQVSNAVFVVLATGVGAATAVDLRTRRIPNELTAAMAVAGVGFAASGLSSITIGASIAGLVLGCVLMLPGYSLGATGGGDVKLMAAVGALMGPALTVNAFLFTAIVGGVLAVGVAVRRQRLGATIAGSGRLLAAPGDARSEIRAATTASRFAYGPAIAVGSVLAALVG